MAKVKFDIEFWKSECEETFQEKHADLMGHGYSSENAKDFLEEVYGIVGGEYGN